MPDSVVLPSSKTEILLSWKAPSIPVHQRTQRWYMTGGGVVVLGVVYGIYSNSWPFAIVMVLCGAMYFLLRGHQPPLKQCAITEQGVLLDSAFTRWDELSGFWFLPTPDYIELHFVPLAKRTADSVIQTGGMNIEMLRLMLASKIPELHEKRESFLDAFVRFCKL